MPARDLKLARECGRALPRNHPLYRRKLELSAEHTALAFGHRSLLENCPLFLCLILGVHSRPHGILERDTIPTGPTGLLSFVGDRRKGLPLMRTPGAVGGRA